jgi:acetyltransferase
VPLATRSWQALDLSRLMTPRSIAVVGASPKRSRGTRVLENLLKAGYEGELSVVHPRASDVLGVPAYPSLSALPSPPDLAVLSIPAGPVPDVVAEAREVGVGAVTVLAIGFGEGHGRGDDGGLRDLAGDDVLVCGPNGFGVASIRQRAIGFNGRLPEQLIAGPVAFISQSGGLAASFPSHMMRRRGMGFSYLVSPGNELGISFEDYLEWLIEDPDTTIVGAYLETLRNPERLRELGVRAEETGTSIVAMKVGTTPFAQEASRAHTAALATDDAIIDALLRQSGIVRVDSLNELAEALVVLSSERFGRAGWRLGVLSGSGGECSHVSDAAEREGFEMPDLADSTQLALGAVLPDFSVRRNPLDGGGAGLYEDPAVFPVMFDVMLADPGLETLALVLGLDTRDWLVNAIVDGAARSDRFVMVYNPMITGVVDVEMVAKLRAVGVPFVEGTETAFAVLAKLLRRTPPTGLLPAAPGARRRAAGERSLDFLTAAVVLDELGIAAPVTHSVASAEEAVDAAHAIGYPVALKVDHPDVAHKTELGGVRLGISADADVAGHYDDLRAVMNAFNDDGAVLVQMMVPPGIEMILGLRVDPVAGPAVVVGMGGIYAELFDDVAVVVPPFTTSEAVAAVDSLRGIRLFDGARGSDPVSRARLVDVIVALGEWALERPDVAVLEVNPLIVSADGELTAVDALVRVTDGHGKERA